MAPSINLFLSTLMLGTIISISTSNWLMMWAGLELNLMSMIPIIASTPRLQESTAAVNYFLVQIIGSTLFLYAAVLSELFIFNPISILLILSMMTKLGAAPLHAWVPKVMMAIPWEQCMLIATWQKISPLAILSITTPTYVLNLTLPTNFSMGYMTVVMFAMLTAITGGIGGLNQSQLRPLLAYSSISHLSWMMMATILSPTFLWLYFIIYSLINTGIMMSMKELTQLTSATASMLNIMPPHQFWPLILMLFSLGGLPPLLGFYAKWIMFSTLMYSMNPLFLIPLMLGSLMNLYYYLVMMFNYIITPSPTSPMMNMSNPRLLSLLTFMSAFPTILFI